MNDEDAVTVLTVRLERERGVSQKLREDLDERDRLLVVLANDAARADHARLAAEKDARDMRTVLSQRVSDEKTANKKLEADLAQAQLDNENLKADLHNADLQTQALRQRLRTGGRKGRRR